MSDYLTPDSPDAFLDHPMMEPDGDRTEVCPVCKGHGGWNLRLNDYGKGRHSRASCQACWGWGYIEPGSCPHEFDSSYKTVGNCLTIWKCKKCGYETTVDSSD